MKQLTQKEYLACAEAALDAIEQAADANGAGIDYERSGHVLTLELDNGSQIIINLQVPLQEIWLAAKTGGSHYRYQNGVWRNTRDGSELFAALSACVSEQLGVSVQF